MSALFFGSSVFLRKFRSLSLLLTFPLLAQTNVDIGQRRQIKTKQVVFDVVERGTGETIVLLPGYGGVFAFRWLAPILIQAGYRCVIVDRTLTSAATGAPFTGLTLREYAVELGEAIKVLGPAHVRVIGHTGGAFAGAMLASERPDVVKSLVVMPAGPTSWPLPALLPEIREATQRQRSIRITDEKALRKPVA